MTEERLKQIKDLKQKAKEKVKAKPFKNMSAAEKNELLEIICKMLGIIEQ